MIAFGCRHNEARLLPTSYCNVWNTKRKEISLQLKSRSMTAPEVHWSDCASIESISGNTLESLLGGLNQDGSHS